MTFTPKSTSDGLSRAVGSYAREGVQVGDTVPCWWKGFALVQPGVTSAALDIIVPSQQRGKADTIGLIIPANAVITSLGLRPVGNLTLAAATGKLKLATALNVGTASLMAETAAAAGGILTASPNANVTNNIALSPASIGGAAVTFKIFATDGGAGAAAAASTVTATKETKVLVAIGFRVLAPFPTEDEVGYAAPKI